MKECNVHEWRYQSHGSWWSISQYTFKNDLPKSTSHEWISCTKVQFSESYFIMIYCTTVHFSSVNLPLCTFSEWTYTEVHIYWEHLPQWTFHEWTCHSALFMSEPTTVHISWVNLPQYTFLEWTYHSTHFLSEPTTVHISLVNLPQWTFHKRTYHNASCLNELTTMHL